MSKEQHIHKYQRVTLGTKGYTVYKCVLPNCTHFIQAPLALSRISLCWGECEGGKGTVIISKDMLSRDIVRPTCENCIAEKKKFKELMKNLEVEC